MDKYENNFEMTEGLYVEVIKKMVPGARYIIYTAAVLLLAVSAIVMLVGKNYSMGIIWIVLSIALTVAGYFGIPMKAKKIYRKQLHSLTDKNGIFTKKITFEDKKFSVTEPKNSASFNYSDIGGVSETKNLFIMILRDKKLVFVKKDCFKAASNSEFIDFLMEKCNAK